LAKEQRKLTEAQDREPDATAPLRAALETAEKARAAAEAQPNVLRARAAAERARIEKTTDAPNLARHAARGEMELAVLQADAALARAEMELAAVAPPKRTESEKKHKAALDSLTRARKALEIPGDSFTPLRGAVKTLESNVETEESRNRPFPTTSTG